MSPLLLWNITIYAWLFTADMGRLGFRRHVWSSRSRRRRLAAAQLSKATGSSPENRAGAQHRRVVGQASATDHGLKPAHFQPLVQATNIVIIIAS